MEKLVNSEDLKSSAVMACRFESGPGHHSNCIFAPLVKLVDTPDLGSGTERCESSSLLGGTKMVT